MKLKIGAREFDVDAQSIGGMLLGMAEEGFEEADLTGRVSEADFELFCRADAAASLDSEQVVRAYKIAHFLQAEKALRSLGIELASRVSACSHPELKLLLSYFDK